MSNENTPFQITIWCVGRARVQDWLRIGCFVARHVAATNAPTHAPFKEGGRIVALYSVPVTFVGFISVPLYA